MQIRSRMCAREFKSDDRPDLYAGDSSSGGVEGHNIDRSKPQRDVFNHAHRRVTCVFPREGPETSTDMTVSGRQNGHRRWKSGIDEEEHVRNKGRGQQMGNVIGKGMSRNGDSNLDSARRTCFTTSTGPTNKPVEFDGKMTSVYQSENHQLWIAEEHLSR